ncbi:MULTISPECIES: TIGR02328 family protein [unclassified Virgibacillus]|uniref:TIGR02328 family protein n=1 Tax=unclassified Virgibacillus TaxID=2620237 RepID=UPI000EF4945A|nr:MULTISPECIES: TIGR02328 family protein [unclassified Virgibacillus]MDY7043102.1 TIGR02328 family protein [Virgibacillus sp. M23]
MRLWHESLIKALPRQQLLGQHRECCALRGKGWGKKHATVNYVFHYSPYLLFLYHKRIMIEMKKREYNIDPSWEDPYYRGKNSEPHDAESFYGMDANRNIDHPIYPEHNNSYLQECIDNLREKGVILSNR